MTLKDKAEKTDLTPQNVKLPSAIFGKGSNELFVSLLEEAKKEGKVNLHVFDPKESLIELQPDSVISPSLDYFASKKGILGPAKDFLHMLALTLHSEEEETSFVEIVNCDKEFRDLIVQMVFVLFPDNNFLVYFHDSLIDEELSCLNHLPEAFKETKNELFGFIVQTDNASFDGFIDDLVAFDEPAKEEKKAEPVIEEQPKKEIEKKVVEEKPKEKTSKQKSGKKLSLSIKEKWSAICGLFKNASEYAKNSIVNGLFASLFIVLSLVTCLIFYFLKKDDNSSFFAICLVMESLYVILAIVPISFAYSDYLERKKHEGKFHNCLLIICIVSVFVSLICGLIEILVGNSISMPSEKIWSFAAFSFGFPVALGLFLLGRKFIWPHIRKNG